MKMYVILGLKERVNGVVVIICIDVQQCDCSFVFKNMPTLVKLG